jgi:2-polyprenyl-3-methyl-5-hydroxy-6-metoxy-1,4-benzoquinol methylase
MIELLYPVIWLVKKSKLLSAVAMRLTQLTGKSKYRIHPKHLITYEKPWYIKSLKKKDVVLDLGCNNGQQTIKIARKVKKVVGLDQDLKQLKIAKNLVKDERINNIELITANLERRFPAESNFFNKVLALDVLEHVENQQLFIKEIKRVLKKQGMALIAIPNSETPWKKLQKKVGLNYFADPDHKVEYCLKEVRQIFEKQGFKILTIEPVVYDTPWVGVIDLIGGLSLSLYQRLAEWKQKKVVNNIDKSTGFRITMVNKT